MVVLADVNVICQTEYSFLIPFKFCTYSSLCSASSDYSNYMLAYFYSFWVLWFQPRIASGGGTRNQNLWSITPPHPLTLLLAPLPEPQKLNSDGANSAFAMTGPMLVLSDTTILSPYFSCRVKKTNSERTGNCPKLSNCGARVDSWESLGQKGDQTSQF